MASAGLKQLRIAETEKYPHVTFFFNGGREEPYPGEDRIMVPSPKVATYDLQPEMSASALTDKVVAAIDSGDYDFIVLNYANPDMVGHTGDSRRRRSRRWRRSIHASGGCSRRSKSRAGLLLLTADHGNCEMMCDPVNRRPAHRAHAR